jgi:hypothetical protein
MYPSIQHDLMKTRVADLHRQAERDRVARAVSRTRRAQIHERRRSVRGHPATVLARRALTWLAALSPWPAR